MLCPIRLISRPGNVCSMSSQRTLARSSMPGRGWGVSGAGSGRRGRKGARRGRTGCGGNSPDEHLDADRLEGLLDADPVRELQRLDGRRANRVEACTPLSQSHVSYA